ncbi:MAG: ATP-binding protein [Planctomycetota bacterium]
MSMGSAEPDGHPSREPPPSRARKQAVRSLTVAAPNEKAAGRTPQEEIAELRAQLAEAEETLRAIREGEVDAIVVSDSRGERIFSLTGAEQIYRLIVETMKEAAVTLTCDGTILFANAQFGQLVKRPIDGILGHPLTEFIAPDNRVAVGALLARSRTEPVKQRLVFQAFDGAAVPAHISSNVLDQPSGTSICIVAADLTDLENSTELIQQLRRQQEALQDADRHKDEFLAMLGHELRNPLAPIANAVDLLRRAGAANEMQRRAHEMMDRQLRHLVRLVDDLLDVSRVSRGKILLRKEVLDLASLVHTAAEDCRPLLESNGLQLEISLLNMPLWIEGDQARIMQIIGNLLANAGKFTPKGGRVSVKVKAAAKGTACITVTDTGEGIEARLLPHIFLPFHQGARSLKTPRSGLGLGLALVKGLAELHGGSVRARSSGPGKGAQLIVTLPLHPPPQPAGPPPPAPVQGSAIAPRRVLLIEDNSMVVEGLQMLLQEEGHTVESTRTGSEGIEKAKAFKPELVICDIDLGGGMDGHAVARALRQEPEVAKAYMVAYSGYGQESDRLASLAAGFDEHLRKPIRIEDLRRVLSQLPAAPV